MCVSYAPLLTHDAQCYNFFFRKTDSRLKCKGRYSSLLFNSLISWSGKIWDFWFNMFFKYHTEGSCKLLVTFLSTFSSATASNSKVSVLECWYTTTVQKWCIPIFCLCNGLGILPLLLGPKMGETNFWDINFSF